MLVWSVIAFGSPVVLIAAPQWLNDFTYRLLGWLAFAVMALVALCLWSWRSLVTMSSTLRSTFGLAGVAGVLTSAIYGSWLGAIIAAALLLATVLLARESRRRSIDPSDSLK